MSNMRGSTFGDLHAKFLQVTAELDAKYHKNSELVLPALEKMGHQFFRNITNFTQYPTASYYQELEQIRNDYANLVQYLEGLSVPKESITAMENKLNLFSRQSQAMAQQLYRLYQRYFDSDGNFVGPSLKVSAQQLMSSNLFTIPEESEVKAKDAGDEKPDDKVLTVKITPLVTLEELEDDYAKTGSLSSVGAEDSDDYEDEDHVDKEKTALGNKVAAAKAAVVVTTSKVPRLHFSPQVIVDDSGYKDLIKALGFKAVAPVVTAKQATRSGASMLIPAERGGMAAAPKVGTFFGGSQSGKRVGVKAFASSKADASVAAKSVATNRAADENSREVLAVNRQ